MLRWTTRFTKQFSCRVPLLGAPMAGFSGGKLAAETTRAGALGFIAAGHLQDLKTLEEQIEIFQKSAPKDNCPLCIGFLGFSALGTTEGWDRYEHVLREYKPAAVQFFAPAIVTDPRSSKHGTNVELAQQYGSKVVAQVGSVQDGLHALESGVDCIMAQGSEAGGHGLRRELGNGTLPLAARLVKLASVLNIPVLAAGGIVDGRGLAAALALGCDGAVLGTRLWASQEALGKDSFKQALVEANSCDDVIRSRAHDMIQNVYLPTPWPEPFDSLGALRNRTSDEWDAKLDKLAKKITSVNSKLVTAYRKAQQEGNAEIAAVHAGQGVGEITSIDPAFDIVERIEEEAEEVVIGTLTGVLQEPET